MKKTRLISLLLAAALAVSGMPMMVSADNGATTAPAAVNLLDGATVTANGTATIIEDTADKYLHLTAIPDTTYFTLNVEADMAKLTGEEALYISFDARAAVTSDITNQLRLRLYPNNWGQQTFIADDMTASYAVPADVASGINGVYLTNEWTNIVVKMDNILRFDGDSNTVWFRNGYNHLMENKDGLFSHPIDVDNIKVYKADGTVLSSYDFNDGNVPAAVGVAAARRAVVDPADFIRATGTETEETTVLFENIVLAPGKYTFDGADPFSN